MSGYMDPAEDPRNAWGPGEWLAALDAQVSENERLRMELEVCRENAEMLRGMLKARTSENERLRGGGDSAFNQTGPT